MQIFNLDCSLYFLFFIYYMLEVDSTNQGQFYIYIYIYINVSLQYNLFI